MTAAIAGAVFIFVLRVIGVTLATLRVLIMTRGHRLPAAGLGFFEVLVYVLAIGRVVQDLNNWWNLLGYCFGFSVGTLLGMWIEDHIALGYAIVRAVSRQQGQAIAQAIRQAGFGATLSWGEGLQGPVAVVTTVVRRKEVPDIVDVISSVDPDVFTTVEELRSRRRGYMRIARHER
ncbi:MAG TPA: DUF2179 domain-containing protein [Anaerolineae bacterium]|nr:DUF2179 domain-containing protein [Anaerolineae bacterium]